MLRSACLVLVVCLIQIGVGQSPTPETQTVIAVDYQFTFSNLYLSKAEVTVARLGISYVLVYSLEGVGRWLVFNQSDKDTFNCFNSVFPNLEDGAVLKVEWSSPNRIQVKKNIGGVLTNYNIEVNQDLKKKIDCLSSNRWQTCLLYTSPSPRDRQKSRMPSSA
eukprot:TRINITY_DN5119_c0_g1_i2.p1 TRINITY_DN5119_c0_g1~~TRINITY_DN5119_c0_g1_i2.p1  ORF type:complete len:163 (+),score=17.38 TRINITY_DN5119_c0_g1_i2:110-598(+)